MPQMDETAYNYFFSEVGRVIHKFHGTAAEAASYHDSIDNLGNWRNDLVNSARRLVDDAESYLRSNGGPQSLQEGVAEHSTPTLNVGQLKYTIDGANVVGGDSINTTLFSDCGIVLIQNTTFQELRATYETGQEATEATIQADFLSTNPVHGEGDIVFFGGDERPDPGSLKSDGAGTLEIPFMVDIAENQDPSLSSWNVTGTDLDDWTVSNFTENAGSGYSLALGDTNAVLAPGSSGEIRQDVSLNVGQHYFFGCLGYVETVLDQLGTVCVRIENASGTEIASSATDAMNLGSWGFIGSGLLLNPDDYDPDGYVFEVTAENANGGFTTSPYYIDAAGVIEGSDYNGMKWGVWPNETAPSYGDSDSFSVQVTTGTSDMYATGFQDFLVNRLGMAPLPFTDNAPNYTKSQITK